MDTVLTLERSSDVGIVVKAQVAVARKLAITMLAMWKSGQRYDPFHVALAPNVVVDAERMVVG